MSSKVPNDVAASAAQQMLATIYSQRAQFQVQQIANGHSDDHPSGVNGQTYAERFAELDEAEARLRADETYGKLLGK